jgi:hypothetical protein
MASSIKAIVLVVGVIYFYWALYSALRRFGKPNQEVGNRAVAFRPIFLRRVFSLSF